MVNEEGFALVQPLWVPRALQAWYPLHGAGKTTFLHHEHLKKLKIKSVGELIEHNSGQFGFGFKVPAAFLMWPCYTHGKLEVAMYSPDLLLEKLDSNGQPLIARVEKPIYGITTGWAPPPAHALRVAGRSRL